MRAKETRLGPREVAEALREAANRGPSELVTDGYRAHVKRPADTPRAVIMEAEDVTVQRKLAV